MDCDTCDKILRCTRAGMLHKLLGCPKYDVDGKLMFPSETINEPAKENEDE